MAADRKKRGLEINLGCMGGGTRETLELALIGQAARKREIEDLFSLRDVLKQMSSIPLKRRGEAVWADVEAAIALRNASGYDKAAALLADLRMMAQDPGDMAVFSHHLEDIRERHARKGRFLERLATLGV